MYICLLALPAEVTVLVGRGAGDQSLDVNRFPVVEIGELDDWGVEAVDRVALFAAGLGEGDGEVADVVGVEVLAAYEITDKESESGSLFRPRTAVECVS